MTVRAPAVIVFMDNDDSEGTLDVRVLGGNARPAVLYFPDGRPTADREAVHEIRVEEGQGVAVVREEASKSMTYVGKESFGVERPCRYALGVFHKTKRRLELMPILGEGVLRMEPHVEGLQYAPSNMTTVSKKGTERERWTEGTRAALFSFGGSVSKKRLREAELNRPTEQSAETGSAIGSIAKSINSKSKEDGLTKKQVDDTSFCTGRDS